MVSIITCTKRPEFLGKIFENFERQQVEGKELILVLHGWSQNGIDVRMEGQHIKIIHMPQETPLGQCFNEAIKHAKYDHIARFDDDDWYGDLYLTEALAVMKEKNAAVVGKQTVYIYFEKEQQLAVLFEGKENRFIHQNNGFLAGSTFLFKREIAEKVKFPPVFIGEDKGFIEKCKSLGLPMYASSRFHYAYIRYEDSHHTSDADNRRLKRHCLPLVKINDLSAYFS
ncbi:glycosyltransferase family 2 protein [Bacillus sp. B-jedd]|uniref:glycosyltransferase family 2 protein n=1 Tax=Bacillus sp. B-jedd TaxID=1476857 RepID=UPI0005156D76|nr:glycosyltransferase [Bacillus sp. B-jedd]CEG25510.1 family 2 glycosyl transferase [Bacillus sp. B-jedd]